MPALELNSDSGRINRGSRHRLSRMKPQIPSVTTNDDTYRDKFSHLKGELHRTTYGHGSMGKTLKIKEVPTFKSSSTFSSHSAISSSTETLSAQIQTPDSGGFLKHIPSFGYPMLINPPDDILPPSPSTKSNAKSSIIQTQTVTSSFSPLPPLLSLASTSHSASGAFSSPTTSSTVPISGVDVMHKSSQDQAVSSHKLATPIIVLLAVGAGCLVFGVCIVVKMWTRPQRKPRIIPSLPILEKGYIDEDSFNCKDSPVFGGKERFTPRPGSDGPLWTWVQYPNPLSKPPESHVLSDNEGGPVKDSPHRLKPQPQDADLKVSPTGYSQSSNGISSSGISVPPPALQQVQTAISRAANRLSTASIYSLRDRGSDYLSLSENPKTANFTADGHSILKRTRRSKSYSVIGEKNRRGSMYHSELPYEGADVSSPVTYFQPVSTSVTPEMPTGTEGRARIQSSYYNAGTYPRLSTMPMTYSIATATKVNLARAQAHTVEKDEKAGVATYFDQRERERALSFAAGFPSPSSEYVVSSPQPTLYPDDSLSVVGSKRSKRRSQTQNRRLSRLGNTGPESSMPVLPQLSGATAGSLLEMDFGLSRMSLTIPGLDGKNTTSVNPPHFQNRVMNSKNSERQIGKGTKLRTDDRAPRVPSPPPLPSLTQMGLAHANPEAYENYRSPTYSIYGLYEGERKSGT